MQQSGTQSGRKLKILSLHGFNNHVEVFKYMTKPFVDQFKDYADFYYLEGPFEVNEDIIPPEQALIDRGFKTPFKAWFYPLPAEGKWIEDMINEYFKSHAPLPEDLEASASVGIEEAVELLAKAFREQGPFDGVLGFSQGNAVFRTFCFMTQHIDPHKYRDIQLPNFVLSFAGSVFLEYLALVYGKLYGPTDYQIKGIDSLHIYGTADPLYEHCIREPHCFVDSPDVMKAQIVHNQGHKVYSKFTENEIKIVHAFMERQLLRVNAGSQQEKSQGAKL